jgi:hypothetical protein
MRARTLGVVLVVSAGLGAMIGGIAAADSGKPAPVIAPVQGVSKPPGWEVRRGAPIAIAPGTVKVGNERCKGASEWPVGGGAVVSSYSPLVALSSDNPIASRRGVVEWGVSVVNTSASATTFSVYVICIDRTGLQFGYSGLWGPQGPTGNSYYVGPHATAGATTQASTCDNRFPNLVGSTGPVIVENPIPPLFTVHGTHPTANDGWQLSVNNTDNVGHDWWIAGACSQAFAYLVVGPAVSNPPQSQTQATAMCGQGVPIAGGIGASSTSPLMSVNSSNPIPGGWSAYENNASTGHQDTIRAYVVCAEAWPG